MKIDNWYVAGNVEGSRALVGNIEGHPNGNDYRVEQITSRIVGKRGDKVVTKSGSEYELGAESGYNLSINSKNALLESLDELEPKDQTVP